MTTLHNLNIDPIIEDFTCVLKNGLNVLLNDFKCRHNMLEETHRQIMMLPSVVNELKKTASHVEMQPLNLETASVPNNAGNCATATVNAIPNCDEFMETVVNKVYKKLEERSYAHERMILQEINSVAVKVDDYNNSVQCITSRIEELKLSDNSLMLRLMCINDAVSTLEQKLHTMFSFNDEREPVKENVRLEIKELAETNENTSELEQMKHFVDEEPTYEMTEEVTEDVEEDVIEEPTDKMTEEVTEEEVTEDVEEEVIEEEVEENNGDTETETEEQPDLEEEEEEELFEIEIEDVVYCTNDIDNGFIYEFKNDEVGEKVGYFKDGDAIFYNEETE
jgi:hypothetical protein